jgi:hypothetical protein
MTSADLNRPAALVASIRAPWRSTVADCLSRWGAMDSDTRASSYLVVEGEKPGERHTLNAGRIAELSLISGGCVASGIAI